MRNRTRRLALASLTVAWICEPGRLGFSGWAQTSAPPARLFQDVGMRYALASGDVAHRAGGTAAGEPGSGHLSVRLDTGFDSSFEPSEGQFRAGPLSIRIASVSGTVAHSDNLLFSAEPREAGWLGVLTLAASAQLEVNPNFRLVAGSMFSYLMPYNRLGWGFMAVPGGGVAGQDVGRLQVIYDWSPAGWEIVAHNDARLQLAAFLADGDPLDVDGTPFGRLPVQSIRSPFGGINNRNSQPAVIARNEVGLTAATILPPEVRFIAGVMHADQWWLGNSQIAYFPQSQEVGFVRLESARLEGRLRPFTEYRVSRWAGQDWNQRVLGGVQARLTDTVEALGQAGYFWADDLQRGGQTMAGLQLTHQVTPAISQTLNYLRTVTEPVRELGQIWRYQVDHQINPNWRVSPFAWYSTFKNLDGLQVDSSNWTAGLEVMTSIRSDTQLQWSGRYQAIRFPGFGDDSSQWISYLSIRRDPWALGLVYQYQDRISRAFLVDFQENVFSLTLTRFL